MKKSLNRILRERSNTEVILAFVAVVALFICMKKIVAFNDILGGLGFIVILILIAFILMVFRSRRDFIAYHEANIVSDSFKREQTEVAKKIVKEISENFDTLFSKLDIMLPPRDQCLLYAERQVWYCLYGLYTTTAIHYAIKEYFHSEDCPWEKDCEAYLEKKRARQGKED
jgi:hypothetical protein